MRRLLLVLWLSSATALLQGQTIASLQSAPNAANGPQYGAAITGGTNLPTFTLYINGTFNPKTLANVTWLNVNTGVQQVFTPFSGGIVNNDDVRIVVTIPNNLFAAVPAAQTVQITVTQQLNQVNLTSNAAIFTLNPPLAAPSPTVLPAGATGVPYSTTIFSGGTPPYFVILADEASPGVVPPGLSLQNSPTLSGIPAQAGLYQYDVQIVDEWGNFIIPRETIEIVGAATISLLSPNTAPAGSNNVAITVTGTNFVQPTAGLNPNYPGSAIGISLPLSNGGLIALAASIINATTATATIPASYLASPQQLNIVAVQPSGVTSNALPFTVLAPAVTTVSPSPVTARTTPIAVTLTGSGFLASGAGQPVQSTILSNGSAVATTFINATSLSTSLVLSTAGAVPFQVENPGGSLSNIVNVTVLPAPAITSVTPSPFSGGKLTVNGVNFTASMSVLFNGTAVATSFVSATQLTATVPAGAFSGSSALVAVQTSDNYVTPATKIILGTPVQITTTSIPVAVGLQPYDAKLAATGGTPPYTWTASGLPQGLSINRATGEITGTPTAFGNFTFSVTVTDVNGLTSSVQFPEPVSAPAPPPQINPATLPNGFVNVSYNYAFTTAGGNGGVTIGLGTGSLPPGLSLDTTGILKGVPTTTGSYTFVVVATDSDGLTSSASFTLAIKPQPLSIITPGPLASVNVGAAISITFTAFGGVPPYTFSASGTVPPGTSMAANGTLSGTATTPGTYAFTVTVNDSAQSQPPGTKSYSITVNPAALTVTGTFGNGQVGVAYSAQVGATGGVPPYSFTVSGLPGGLTIANGTVSGTPNAGTYTVSVTVTDSAKTTASQTFPVTISVPPVTITTTSLPNGVINVAYAATLSASGGAGTYSWSVTGLPPGVSADTTGAISGTPTAAGSYSVSATVISGSATTFVSASKSFSITVAGPPLSVTTASLANATAGTAYSATLAATGGVPPYTWTATGLPSGLTVSPAGAISGTTTVTGAASVSVIVKDSAGTTASQTLQLTVVLPTAPTLSITGLPTTTAPATQSTIAIGIAAPYPVAVTVNLTLTFTAVSGPDDPTVQFSTGGRTAQLTIPAGATTGSATVGVQTGTVAGTATVTAQLLAGSVNITPTPAPTSTVKINSVAPVISSVTATSNSTGFTVTVIGYATSRIMTSALFTFAPAAGVSLQTTSVTVTAGTLFSTWYSSSAATPFGGQFSFVQPFTVSGATGSVASVTVTLTNPDGSSTPVSAAVH